VYIFFCFLLISFTEVWKHLAKKLCFCTSPFFLGYKFMLLLKVPLLQAKTGFDTILIPLLTLTLLTFI